MLSQCILGDTWGALLLPELLGKGWAMPFPLQEKLPMTGEGHTASKRQPQARGPCRRGRDHHPC